MNTMNNLDLQATDLANAVPAEEQAVELVQTELPPLTVVIPPRPAELAMAEEEQAVDPGETDNESHVMRKYGALATIDGMANIQPVFDNRLYASVSVDGEGNRSIVFCEKYSDGTFSPKMKIAQSGLHMLQMFEKTSPAPLAVKMRNYAAKFLLELSIDYLNKFSGDTPLDMAQTLKVLLLVKNQLPVYKAEPTEQTPEQFYLGVLEQIRVLNIPNVHKAYYALELSHINVIAREMDMAPKDLLEKLKEYGFLYLAKSSSGYKTNVRVTVKPANEAMKEEYFPDGNSFTMWAYCIYKKEHIEKVING